MLILSMFRLAAKWFCLFDTVKKCSVLFVDISLIFFLVSVSRPVTYSHKPRSKLRKHGEIRARLSIAQMNHYIISGKYSNAL